MKVPFIDLPKQYRSIKKEINVALQEIMNQGDFILGRAVKKFEENFAEYCQCKYGIGVGSGLDALTLSLIALDIKQKDEIIIPANTYVATALAVSRLGARPVLVDCYSDTYTLDLNKLKEVINRKTKAIIAVHLYGHMVDMVQLLSIADKYGLRVIEDACQAHGAEYNGKKAGSFGDIGCFSFYPSKNLGAYGDGGFVTTNNSKIANRIYILRNYGSKVKYRHCMKGINSRLDSMQAAILNIKLKYLNQWNQQRRSCALRYNKMLEDVEEINTPVVKQGFNHVFHVYAIQVERRDYLQEVLNKAGISTIIHYPIPLHLLTCYRDLKYKKGDFPIVERCSRRILSLPIFPEISNSQIDYIVKIIKKTFFSFK